MSRLSAWTQQPVAVGSFNPFGIIERFTATGDSGIEYTLTRAEKRGAKGWRLVYSETEHGVTLSGLSPTRAIPEGMAEEHEEKIAKRRDDIRHAMRYPTAARKTPRRPSRRAVPS